LYIFIYLVSQNVYWVFFYNSKQTIVVVISDTQYAKDHSFEMHT